MFDYSKTKLAGAVDEVTITSDIGTKQDTTKPKEVSTSTLTQSIKEKVYPYLHWIGSNMVPPDYSDYAGKGFDEIASETGATIEQVKELHAEYQQMVSSLIPAEVVKEAK